MLDIINKVFPVLSVFVMSRFLIESELFLMKLYINHDLLFSTFKA